MDAYIDRYFDEMKAIIDTLDRSAIERIIDLLLRVREARGRLFFLGVGGGAANASHAVNDFRKIAGLEAYAPSDNVAELTARTNDEGWETVFRDWLLTSRVGSADAVFVFSVGGGSVAKRLSVNIVEALKTAKAKGAKVIGIVGRDGGYTKECADACVVIPTQSADTVTAHAESFQAVVGHLIVSHPRLKVNPMKWESVK